MQSLASLAVRVRELLERGGFSTQILAGEEEGSSAVTLIARDRDPVGPTSTAAAASSTAPTLWWERAVPRDLPESVLCLGSRLTGGCSLSGKERLELAYARGKQASAICRGEIGAFAGERCYLKNRCYVVFFKDEPERSFFTWSYSTYSAEVGVAEGPFDPNTVSHGFASKTEAFAFSLGAGFSDLPETR